MTRSVFSTALVFGALERASPWDFFGRPKHKNRGLLSSSNYVVYIGEIATAKLPTKCGHVGVERVSFRVIQYDCR
jgi:hypothetical protein